MKIKSFGCSFIYGSELGDEIFDSRLPVTQRRPSKLSWPALIAKNMSAEYKCFATPGCGNLQIANSVYEQLAHDKDSDVFYIIGWTWQERFDYQNSLDFAWQTICPARTDQVAAHYYKNIHSEPRDKLTTLIAMSNTIQLLKNANVPYIMTNIDGLLFDKTWHATNGVQLLQNIVEPVITTFDGRDFLSWARNLGLPISERNHPLAVAHLAAAEIMIDQVKQRYYAYKSSNR